MFTAVSDSGQEPWPDLARQALALASALRSLSGALSSDGLAACSTYATIVDEISRWAATRGAEPKTCRISQPTPLTQLQAFGHLLRDKRNQAGFSRLDLARKAKLSDSTIKFLETARHPPSRATLLRLVGVPELGLSWADTPEYASDADPSCLEPTATPSLAAQLHRFEPRLTVPVVLDLVLLLDELHAGQYLIELTAHGARRVCCLCHARSEGWAVEPDGAAKLPLHHALPCAGRLADTLLQRHPVIAELAKEQRRNLRTPLALDLDACRRATLPERFYGFRSGREVASVLTRLAALSPTPHRDGATALLLWALSLGPCPVEPESDTFSASRARRIAERFHIPDDIRPAPNARMLGIAAAAAWLTSPAAPEPDETSPPEAAASPNRNHDSARPGM